MTENQTNSKEMWDMLFDRKRSKYLNKHASVSRPAELLKLLLAPYYSVGDRKEVQFPNQDFFFNGFLYMDLKA